MNVLVVVEASETIERISAILQRGSLHSADSAPKYQYHVHWWQPGQAPFDLIQNHHPDLILLDAHFRATSAKDICAYVRERDAERHTGIVFLGAASDRVDLSVECLEMGADDYFRLDTTDREFLARINAVLRLKAMTDDLRSANHRLHLLSLTDELTGLHNMRSFNQTFAQKIRQVRDGKTGVGVIMIDLDHFKKVNDSANHLVGSYVIGEVGKLIRCSGILGADDCAARYGGDEYVIMIGEGDLAGVMEKSKAIHELIGQAAFLRDGFSVKLTASVGAAWCIAGYAGKDEDVIKAADLMLYQSKRLGRNRINGVELRDPIDLDHISRAHLVDGDSGSDDHYVARVNYL